MDVPPELIGPIIEMADYQTLKAMALTNKFYLAEVRRFLNRLVLKARKKFPQAATIEHHELIERIYYLNEYKTNTFKDIVIDKTKWSKGKCKIITTPDHQYWQQDGKYHRIDGPARTLWTDAGIKTYEIWFQEGKEHRTDGPARTTWDATGIKTDECWFQEGKEHRIDGPAFTRKLVSRRKGASY